MEHEDYAEAPIVQLRTEEEIARAREQLAALQNAAPASVDALIRVALENALRALEAAAPGERSSDDATTELPKGQRQG
jgi:uncharacterized protein YdaU (DUF1376 family)